MRRDTWKWSAAAAVAVLLAAGASAEQKVPGGTPVILEILQDLHSKTSKVGDEVKLRAHEDVVVNGKTVIRKDAPARGVVSDLKKPGPFGKRARLVIKLENVKDVNGDLIRLDPYTSGGRYRPTGPGVSGAGLIILGPAGLVGGAFVKGNHISIKQGTRLQALVAAEPPAPPATGK